MESSQNQEVMQQSDNSAVTPVRPQGKSNPRVLFEQDSQSQEPNQEVLRPKLETRNNQPVPKGPDGH